MDQRNSEVPLYLFLHQYKTAGTTLVDTLSRNLLSKTCLRLYVAPLGLDVSKRVGHPANPGYRRDRVDQFVTNRGNSETRMLMGHMVYPGIHERITPRRFPRYFTFLRHPLERAISLYFYLRYNSENYWHYELVNANWSLDEWLDKSAALWAHNGQTRHLLLGAHEQECLERELSPKLLQEAKQWLERFWFVGSTETFSRDSAFLYGKFQFSKFAPVDALMVTKKKEPLSAKTYDRILELNQLDLELYEYARELRGRFVRRYGPNYFLNVMLAQIRKSRYRRTSEKDSPPAGAKHTL